MFYQFFFGLLIFWLTVLGDQVTGNFIEVLEPVQILGNVSLTTTLIIYLFVIGIGINMLISRYWFRKQKICFKKN